MKKIIAIILILICALSQNAYAASEAVQKDLYDLGIMVGDEGGNLNIDRNITRAEAAKVICVAGALDTDEEKHIEDVPAEHWAYNYICAILESGLMKTDEYGCFNPDDTITNEEIVTMIVKLLGYEARAMVLGGASVGFVTVGTSIGVTGGLQFEVNTPAKRGDAAVLIYNALDIPLMCKGEVEGGIVWKIMDGEGDTPLETLRIRITP